MKTILTSLISGAVAGILVLVGSLGLMPPREDSQPISLGSATSSVSYVPTLIPIATSTIVHPNDLGTTSETGDRRFGRAQFDYASTVSQDVLDELKIGRSATTTITEGTITTTDLTVTGTCTGCAGSSDFQDIYNSSAVDAQILTTTGKDIIFFLANTDANAVFQILSGTNGEGQLQIGTADGSATTTTGVWAGYGGLGIGTTSPGGGLAVSATSSIFGGPVYALDHLRTSYLIATSTTATSTIPSLSVSTNLSAVNVLITGDLNVDTGTSTFGGGINIVAQGLGITAGGLNITAGDLLTAGVIKISSTGTSTNAGTITLDSANGTSTIAGNLEIAKSLILGGSVYPSVASSTNTGTTTVIGDCGITDITDAINDRDIYMVFKNCFGGQFHMFRIDDPRHDAEVHQLNWLGIVDANGEYGSSTLVNTILFDKTGGSTTTPGLCQGYMNVFTAMFASSSDNQSVKAIIDGPRCYGY